MGRRLALIALSAVALALAAEPAGEVRIVWAVPHRDTVSVRLQGATDTITAPALPAPVVTAFAPLPAGPLRLTVTAAGAAAPLLADAIPRPVPPRATLVVLQRLGEPRFVWLADPRPAVPAGQAVIRVAHALPDVERLRAELWRPVGRKWQSVGWPAELKLGQTTPRLTVAAGAATLKVYKPGEDAPLFETDTIRLAADSAVTLLVTGLTGAGEGDLPVGLCPLDDGPVVEPAP